MGAAPMAYTLWTRFLRHAPTPARTGRTATGSCCRAGHASMLLYSLLHLTGYDVSLDDLKSFRQWGSKTPGHPEYGLTPGVEATTGPLGQGFANAVGMAIAERRLAPSSTGPATTSSTTGRTRICSDGDLQEGIASEAASLAGHLRLGKLIDLYDDNHIQLDGPDDDGRGPRTSSPASTRTAGTRSGSRTATTSRRSPRAIEAARGRRPAVSLIAVRTHIGFGSPNRQDTQKAHGQPLGADEVRLAKEAYGWDPDETFFVPDEALAAVPPRRCPAGEALVEAWDEASRRATRDAFPDLAAELRRRLDGRLARRLGRRAADATPVGEEVATRNASQEAIQALAGRVPELFGGAADLSESNLTDVKGGGEFQADEPGRNIRFGVREHAMGGVANGIAYHGGFIPYAGTFLTFSDYMRGSVRLAALSGLHVIYVWTHDSVGPRRGRPDPPAGRALRRAARDPEPVVRPAGRRERGGRGVGARGRARRGGPVGPVALSLTRQKLPTLAGTAEKAREGVRRGGYVLREAAGGADPAGDPDRHRLGAAARVRRRRGARGGRRRDPGRVAALLGAVRAPGRGLPRVGPAAGRPQARRASRPASRSAGSAGSATRARSSGSTTSAHRRRPGRSSRSSASRSIASPTVARDVVAGKVHGPIPTLEPGHLPAPRGGHPTIAGGEPGRRPASTGTRPGPQLMRVAFAADHAGAALKDELVRPPRGGRPRPRADRPRRRRLRPARRLPGLRRAARRGDPRRAAPSAASSSAAAASARASRPTRCAASVRPSATTRTRPTRASSTTT